MAKKKKGDQWASFDFDDFGADDSQILADAAYYAAMGEHPNPVDLESVPTYSPDTPRGYADPYIAEGNAPTYTFADDPSFFPSMEERAQQYQQVGTLPSIPQEQLFRAQNLAAAPPAGTEDNPFMITSDGKAIPKFEANTANVPMPTPQPGEGQSPLLGQPGGSGITTKKLPYFSKQTVSANLTPEQAQAAKDKMQALQDSQDVIKYNRLGAYEKIQSYLKSQKGAGAKRLVNLEEEKKYIEAKMEDLEAHISEGVVHPFQKMPVAGQLASMIAVGFGAIANASSGGKVPNTALAMFNKAIDRDLSIQRNNLQNSMRLLNLNDRTKRTLQAQMEKVEGRQRQDALKALELEVLKQNVNSDSITARQKAIEFSVKLDQLSTPKTVKNSGYKTALVKPTGAEGVGKLGQKMKRDFVDGVGALQKLKDLKGDYKALKPIQGFRFFGGESARYVANRDDVIAAYVKFMTGVQQRKEEYDRLKKTFPQGFGIGEWSEATGIWKIDKHQKKAIAKLANMARMHPQLMQVVPQEYKAAIAAEARFGTFGAK